uniref:CMP-N-acetylneuraminate-beta-galactosamide-alpha-2,3-sialyltransferase 1 n=1 Tax=Myripristis murdjan TaxID=586833 RepID=A0A667X9H2_9TELE
MLSRKRKIFFLLLYVTTVSVLFNGRQSARFVNYISHVLETRSCACQKCLSEGEPWFMDRYNQSVKPFLSRKHGITEDIFNWWKRLQGDRSSFNNYTEAIDKVFQMIPDKDHNTQPSPDKCRSCAVVGNSRNLKGSHYGALIDSHDIIMRMNRGRTQGYEIDVGTRTTHHVMYPESAKPLPNTTHLVLFPFKTKDFRWTINYLPPSSHKYQPTKNTIELIMLSPAFMKYVHENWLLNPTRTYPSTGFMAVVLSLHMCDEVSVFGFGADSDGNWSHYFEELRNKLLRTGLHKGPQEYRIIQQLFELQKIHMYKGW